MTSCQCDNCKLNKSYKCKTCSRCGQWAYPEIKCFECDKILDNEFLCIMTEPESDHAYTHFCSGKCLIEHFMLQAEEAESMETTTDKLHCWERHAAERKIDSYNKPVFKPNRALRRSMGEK